MTTTTPRHLVVLCHGLHGKDGDMRGIADLIEEYHGSKGVKTHCAASICGTGFTSNLRSPFVTSLGIQEGSRLLSQEIADRVEAMMGEKKEKVRLSLVGTSLGGLYQRSAAALLFESGRFSHLTPFIEPASFITFATPHLGVRGHLPRLYQAAVDLGAVGRTGFELMLKDSIATAPSSDTSSEHDEKKKPLLAWMADPSLPYYRSALARFKTRIAVACTASDDKVPFHSASIVCPLDSDTAKRQLGEEVPLSRETKEVHPHLAAVYRQHRATGTTACSDGYDDGRATAPHPAPAPPSTAPLSSAIRAAGLAVSEAEGEHISDGAPNLALESQMASSLRSLPGGWTTVHATFDEFGAFLLNHYRVSYSHPLLTMGVGKDVAAFVAKELFEA